MKYEELMSDEEIEIVNGQKDEAKRMIDAAKIAMLRYRPFYGALVGSMPMSVAFKWLPTIATDGRNLYYNPEFIVGMTPERRKLVHERIDSSGVPFAKRQEMKEKIDVLYGRKTTKEVIFLLEHEIRHIICDHMTRGKGYNHQLFNIAADHYINVALIQEHSVAGLMGGKWFMDKDTKFNDRTKPFAFMEHCYRNFKYENWVTEKIYEDLVKEQENGKGKMPADHHMGTGSGNGGAPMPSEGDGDDESGEGQGEGGEGMPDLAGCMGINKYSEPTLTNEQRETNREIMRRSIISATQSAGGEAPKDVRDLVASFGKSKINYVKLIKKKMMALIRTNVTYKRPSRRSFGLTHTLRASGAISSRQSVVLPSATKDNQIDIWIGFDVSGSVTDALLERIFREICGLTMQYKQFKIHLFCWSTHVGEVKVYTKDNIREIVDYRIDTSGGTIASCVFKFLDNQKEKVDQLIVFTDGYFEDLSSRKDWARKYDTLWVIFQNSNWKEPFGKSVDFDKYVK